MWILSTWKWNSRGGLAIIVWTGGRRASRRDWEGLGQTIVPEKWMQGQRAGLALWPGMQFKKTALCWNRFCKATQITPTKWVRTPPPLTFCARSVPCHSGPSYGCFTDPCLLNFQCSLTQSAPGGSDGEESACSAGDPGSIPGSGRSPQEETATHSSTLAWRIPWTEGPVGLQSVGSHGFPNSGCEFWPA